MKSFIVTAYYTTNTFYAEHAGKLARSLQKFGIPHVIEAMPNKGTWLLNTGCKPSFLRRMLDQYKQNIVYVDVDAEFMQYPELFETIEGDVAVHEFDRTCYRNPGRRLTEVLSGTIFLRNNEKVRGIVDNWIKSQERSPGMWDQLTLEKVLNGNFTRLPGEYCKIFDRQPEITKPVIVHYQASRQIRNRTKSVALIQ